MIKLVGRMGVFVLTLALLVGCKQEASATDPTGLWQKDYDSALKQASAENKPMLVSLSGLNWCGWCKALEKEVFSQPEFIAYAQEHLICVLLDFDREGRATDAKFAPQHERLLEKFQVQGFPTVLILNPQGKGLVRDGYRRGGAARYVEFIQGVLTNASSH